MYDVLIIGAGIIGSFLAYDLSKYQLKTAVIEKESDVGNVATMANSAIIHSGHDPKEGTLKAKLNVRGNQMYPSICESLGVEFMRTSAFVAATSKEEEAILEQLYEQSRHRRIEAVYMSGEEARKYEKNLSDQVTKVLELPSTGILSPWEMAIALMETAVLNDVELRLDEHVLSIESDITTTDSYEPNKQTKLPFFRVHTNRGIYETMRIINAAGIYADDIYQMAAQQHLFQITPRRGEYYVLDKQPESFVSRVIYPVPSKVGKGVLAVPTIHGNLLIGPNSTYIDDKEGINNTSESLQYVKTQINKTLSNLPFQDVIRNFAGLRPSSKEGDFIIEESKELRGFINAACIDSPGLASAPAISEYIMNEILKPQIHLREKEVIINRQPITKVRELSHEDRDILVQQNPAYGRIICRCEQITEGEILEAIHRPIGARTVKAVKKRVRPGMGRCQGGFCEPLVVQILARELSLSPMEIQLDSADSFLFVK